MKLKIIFGLIAVAGTLALYLTGYEHVAIGFAPIVWGIYERVTKEEIKEDFKQAKGQDLTSWRKINKE